MDIQDLLDKIAGFIEQPYSESNPDGDSVDSSDTCNWLDDKLLEINQVIYEFATLNGLKIHPVEVDPYIDDDEVEDDDPEPHTSIDGWWER